ncbi:MAG: ATP synthase F1 subunit delta [Bacteroidales bacterium]|nr:ATP synthase F1 subunit delta [Bacteroidales bacterium]
MNDSKISVRYAKALLQAAMEKGCEDAVRSDMVSLLGCINESPDFRTLLESPVVADSKKVEIFDNLFAEHFSALTTDFFKVLVKNKRENFLKIICMNFSEFYARSKNIKRVRITSAVETSGDVQQSIKALAKDVGEGSDVELTVQVDPEIIGGLIVQVEDKVYDASVRTQLARIKEQLK